MTKEKFGKHLEIIMKEMCKRVHQDYNKMDFSIPEWFYKNRWNEEEQKSFADWLTKYLMDNSEARTEIMQFPRKDIKAVEKVVTWFIFNYGWRLDEGLTEVVPQ